MRLIGLKSQDLTGILISEDKASAKKIKGKSVDLSSGAGRDRDLPAVMFVLLLLCLSYHRVSTAAAQSLSIGVFFI